MLAVIAQFGSPERRAMSAPPAGEYLWLLEQTDPAKEVEFFSGEVTEITPDRIEVVRTALGKSDSRRFSVSDETKFEGTPKKGSRVTVGYYAKSPEAASRVIVRDGEN